MIGWEHKTLQVEESVGRAGICFLVLQGISFAQDVAVIINITTRDGTASQGGRGFQQDYIPLPQSFTLRELLAGNIFCAIIPIVDDSTFDSAVNETFFVDLSLVDVIDRVTISPSTVVVSIIDNEGKHIKQRRN